MTVITNSTLRCPECGFAEEVDMPTDACQYFYQCRNCKAVLKPKTGDCCVFCSYGTIRCPPKQIGECCYDSNFALTAAEIPTLRSNAI